MTKHYLSQLILALTLAGLHQSAKATQNPSPHMEQCLKDLEESKKRREEAQEAREKSPAYEACLAKLKLLEDKKEIPTLKDILHVEPVKEPWGVNLDLVAKRGQGVRGNSLDQCDFSSRITLYPKEKKVVEDLTQQVRVKEKERDDLNEDINKQTKLLKKFFKKAKAQQAIKKNNKALKALNAEIDDVKCQLAVHTDAQENFAETITKKTGLTRDKIDQVPIKTKPKTP